MHGKQHKTKDQQTPSPEETNRCPWNGRFQLEKGLLGQLGPHRKSKTKEQSSKQRKNEKSMQEVRWGEVAKQMSRVPPQNRAELSEVVPFRLHLTCNSPKPNTKRKQWRARPELRQPKAKKHETTNPQKIIEKIKLKGERRRTHTKTKCKI